MLLLLVVCRLLFVDRCVSLAVVCCLVINHGRLSLGVVLLFVGGGRVLLAVRCSLLFGV